MAPAPGASTLGGSALGGSAPGAVAPTAQVGTAITYQGRLLDSAGPATGPYHFEFRLYDAAVGGAQIGSTQTVNDAAVDGGFFTVQLDFGPGVFGGGARWLDTTVRPGAGQAYTPLAPRHKLNPAPYALGLPNVYTNEASGFVGIGRSTQVSGVEDFGVQSTTSANEFGGMYINASDPAGWPFYGYATGGLFQAWTYYDGAAGAWNLSIGSPRLRVPHAGGLEILPTAGVNGLWVQGSADDGIQIGGSPNYPNYGLYIPSPGVPYTAIWPNTANANGDFALYTVDNIMAGTITFSAQTIIARVAGGQTLLPGDIAAATGVAEPLSGGTNRLAEVQAAGSAAPGVIGVVAQRMEWRPAEGAAKDEMVLMPAKGPADAGDLVSLVVLGVTDVRLAPGATVNRGARLTAAETDGKARSLRTETLNGMKVTEGAPVVGVALEDARGGDSVPVFVNLR